MGLLSSGLHWINTIKTTSSIIAANITVATSNLVKKTAFNITGFLNTTSQSTQLLTSSPSFLKSMILLSQLPQVNSQQSYYFKTDNGAEYAAVSDKIINQFSTYLNECDAKEIAAKLLQNSIWFCQNITYYFLENSSLVDITADNKLQCLLVRLCNATSEGNNDNQSFNYYYIIPIVLAVAISVVCVKKCCKPNSPQTNDSDYLTEGVAQMSELEISDTSINATRASKI